MFVFSPFAIAFAPDVPIRFTPNLIIASSYVYPPALTGSGVAFSNIKIIDGMVAPLGKPFSVI
jgi:hypothetical protein